MIKNIDCFYLEYPGDSKWEVYASLARNENISELGKEFPFLDEKILQVIQVKLGKRASVWLSAPNPAIDGISPEKLSEFDGGVVMLKTLLMRMP